jgi:hypothetical protein
MYSRESVPFIRIVNGNLNLQNNPVACFNKTNVPVISCIGTSRDGKSTFLNVLINYILRHRIPNFINSVTPFHAAPSDEPVTLGVDMFKPSDDIDCIMFDCQGMQLQNAKHDAHLGLLTYNISDIIILTVRRVLDLQVLNNLLPMFIFLIDIPEEHRRPDKPILIIRIMDYNNKKFVNDEKYLNKLIDTWLYPNGDQYNKIKEALRQNFLKIVCVPTLPPIFDNTFIDTDGYPIEDYVQTEFLTRNVSWQNTMAKIYTEIKECEYVSKLDNLDNCIRILNENKNLEHNRLDFYNLIIDNELLKYHSANIVNNILFDTTILQKMNGSMDSFNMYTSRTNEIHALKNLIYEHKFKSVPNDLIDIHYKKDIDRMFDIVNNSRNINNELAEKLIVPYWNTFKCKFDNVPNIRLVADFMNIFIEHKIKFIGDVKFIDITTVNKYVNLINIEHKELLIIKTLVDKKNNDIKINIDKKINSFSKNVDKIIVGTINNFINSITLENKKYNISRTKILTNIINKLYTKFVNIFIEYNEIAYMNPEYKSGVKVMTYRPINNNNTEYYIDKIVSHSEYLVKEIKTISTNYLLFNTHTSEYTINYTDILKNIFNNQLTQKLTSIGFLEDVNYVHDIIYTEITVCEHKYVMTSDFYDTYYDNSVIPSIISILPYIVIVKEEKQNIVYITITPPDNIHHNSAKLTFINNKICETFISESLMLAMKLNIQLC